MGRFRAFTVVLSGVMLLAAAGLAGCSSDSGVVDNARLRELQSEGTPVIDVRTSGEFEAGHIPGAIHVPLESLTSAAEGWDPSLPVVLYCATGARSAEAAQVLRSLGFERVYDLAAGIIAWDGEVTRGAPAVASETPAEEPEPVAAGLPVLYEFYTDW